MSRIVLIIISLLIAAPSFGFATTKSKCKQTCEFQRDANIKQCMKEEGEYWDEISETELVRHCRFLTYYEYIDCCENCINPNKRALEFYDKNVKNFPLEKMSNIYTLKPGEQLYPRDRSAEIFKMLLKAIIGIVFYFLPAFVAGEAAKRRGYKQWYWFVLFSIVFTPILGFLAVIAFPTKVNYIKVIR